MIEIKKAHELDIVELTEDLPEFGLRRGERGTVVEVFDKPEEAYIVEFMHASEASSKLAYGVKPGQIVNVGPVDAEALCQHMKLYAQGGYLREEKTFKPSEGKKRVPPDESFFRAVDGNGDAINSGAYSSYNLDWDINFLVKEGILVPERWQDIGCRENGEYVCTKIRRYNLTDEGRRLISLDEDEVLAYFAAKGINERVEHDEHWG